MSEQVIFRLDDGDYEELQKRAGGASVNLKAREILLDALYSQDTNSELSLKVAVRTHTVLLRLVEALLEPEKAAILFQNAAEDEQVILSKMGLSDG